MTNKTNEVLKQLQEHKSITSMDAIDKFGATRLSAIIFNLRKRGYIIVNRWEETIDRYGNECRYVRYIYLGHDCEKLTPEDKKRWKEYIQEKVFGKINKILYGDK